MNGLSEQQQTTLHLKLLEQETTLRYLLKDNEDTSKPVQLDQQALGRVSRIDAIQQQKMAIANRTNQEFTLVQIMQALRKVKEDDYGYCQECDIPIPYKRLLTRPETNLCIQCQSAYENNT
ncbi:MAG: TraR/DksA C4-type zinc finger protein [Pseudomonadales bacterium]|nr:TraR/DksA C4-type zinc finger protein [Pseudomonadales bacterium]